MGDIHILSIRIINGEFCKHDNNNKCGRDGGGDRRSGSIIIVLSSLDARLPCKDGHQHVNIRLVRFPI